MANYTSFTLSNILYDKANEWIKQEENTKGSIVGEIIKTIKRKNKMRDAQIDAIKIYLWLKEKGKSEKLSQMIKQGSIFDENTSLYHPGDSNFIYQPVKRFINRYLEDSKVTNKSAYLETNATQEEYNQFIDNLFEDFNYTNYLFSLPMGAGKTFLIAAFIYIDLYMIMKTNDTKTYAKNFIVLAPPAKKTSILPSLKNIKLFDPTWILPDVDAKKLKRMIKIEILDEFAKGEKLQNQNPNAAKIKKTVLGHEMGNVFIINTEKILSNTNLTEREFENKNLAQQTKIKRANNIKEALAKLGGIQVFIDEAHHSYSSDSKTKKLREELDNINKYNNIKCCIGLSGTPYVNRKIKFLQKELKVKDIQDIVYYYPLNEAIGNFLKVPEVIKDKRDQTSLINSALDKFFNEYDITYGNKTKSKMVFYCSNIEKLNEEVLPIIYKWYEEHGRDKNEILKYYTNVKSGDRYALPKENLRHFYNLDDPTSKFRIVLLVAVGTEGWDCKSLTGVVVARHKSEENFVLQTTCRCLREVEDASREKALIYLDESNYATLDDELHKNYNLHISDLSGQGQGIKQFPVYNIKDNLGTIYYNKIYDEYNQITEGTKTEDDYKNLLSEYSFEKFKEKYPFSNQIGTTTISSGSLEEAIHYTDINETDYEYTFVDFIYELEKSSYGLICCAELMKYKTELKEIYEEIVKNLAWIVNHKTISTFDVCKDITMIFADGVKCEKITKIEKVSVNLLKWNMAEKPVINVSDDKKDYTYPVNSYYDIEEGEDVYEYNLEELAHKFDRMRIANKEKSFSYLPYRMDSSYEYDFLANALKNMDDLDIELYYNGYKNKNLESLKIQTPYGDYTPDFLLIKREGTEISKIMLIETKGHPFETPEKEKYIKEIFLKYNTNYFYERIGDTVGKISECEKMVKIIKEFANK